MREREWASDAVGDRQGQWRAASRAPPLFNAAKVRSSLPLVAHCARSTMDGVERRGRGSLERWIEIRGVGTMVGEQPFESAHSVFTVFPHFNSARFGKKFIKRSAAGEAHRSTRIPPPLSRGWREKRTIESLFSHVSSEELRCIKYFCVLRSRFDNGWRKRERDRSVSKGDEIDRIRETRSNRFSF